MIKSLGDLLLSPKPIEAILMGNHALVRAMLETHTKVITSYPGSPTPEIAEGIDAVRTDACPFYFEYSVNEKVATEVALGAALNGNLSCAFFKSVGLNVALDTFVQLSLLTIIGGMVVVVGDDPGANSSQNEQDNRNVYRMARVTVLEPSCPQEAYAYYKKAADIARKEQTIVVLRMTTHVCHARQKIRFDALADDPEFCTDFNPENGPYITLTRLALEMKRNSIERLDQIRVRIRDLQLNQVIRSETNAKKGVITAGLPYLSVLDCLESASYRPDILKLGAVYPLDAKIILEFLNDHDQVLILEELDPVLEFEIKSLAYDGGLGCRIIGKSKPEDYIGEYTPDKTYEKLRQTWPDMLPRLAEPLSIEVELPQRPAQMCPGCGHRSAFFAIKEALSDQDVTVADVGCHTLGFMPPHEMGQLMLCMGSSVGMASGLALKNQKRIVAFLGDSTFFHAGLPGVINSIFNHHDITLIIMDNGTTAMTGHQDHAGNHIPILTLLESLGIESITRCDTYSQSKLKDLVRASMTVKGISVVIAQHPCMLKFTRERRKKPEYIRQHVSIDPDLCNRSHTCVSEFACPSFIHHPDGRIDVNTDLCIGDGSCRATCPQNAIGFNAKGSS